MRCHLMALFLVLSLLVAYAGAQVEEQEPIYLTPDETFRMALVDLNRNVAPGLRIYTRYLTLYYAAHSPEELSDQYRLAGFTINSLSRRGLIKRAVVVPRSGGTLLRIQISDYDWAAAVWEKVGLEDRYFHAPVIETQTITEKYVAGVEQRWWESGYYDAQANRVAQGQGTWSAAGMYPTNVYKERQTVVQKKKLAAGLGLDALTVKDLTLLTNSQAPVLRVDWLVSYGLKPPFYHDFLKIEKKEADFQKNNVAADLKTVEKFEKDRRQSVTFSGITIKNRRLDRIPTFLGAYWFSTDCIKGVGSQNYSQVLLDRKAENFDASEQIFSLSNGLQGYALFNNKGDRQDKVPQEIAGNKLATGNDPSIYNGLSCIVCHSDGIIAFRSSFKALIRPGSVDITSPDYFKLDRLIQLYDEPLVDYFKEDQARYNKAVRIATQGWDGPTLSTKLSQLYDRYYEKPVTRRKAALDLGVPEDKMVKYLQNSHLPELIGLAADPPEVTRRDQWEQAFPEAMRQCLPHYDAKRRAPQPKE